MIQQESVDESNFIEELSLVITFQKCNLLNFLKVGDFGFLTLKKVLFYIPLLEIT